ncbi:PhzF family phenazine biosynthesis protein [Rhodanobacter geophilus]|uniref:PhzF family phenazine biosynthesis protein n=1 Tax=Rhodanobacter geophilus TaxID=3162488 RepID=A0ABV3QK96_9GAMM
MNAMHTVRFSQVDVFSAVPFKGNPLAVVFDADGLDTAQMQAIARWTNLSETTFLLAPDDPEADYRVRIFTTAGELPFAGHPTLGTAYALRESGYRPRRPGRLVQQCGVGLVELAERAHGRWAFAAPPARIAPLPADHRGMLARALGSDAIDAGAAPCTVDNGAPWLLVRMRTAADCLGLRPDDSALAAVTRAAGTSGVAIYGPHAADGPADFEMRCLMTGGDFGFGEDPVTGSANAALACLLEAQGKRPATSYTVRQGTVLERDGRVAIDHDEDGRIWIGGDCVTVIEGRFRCS